MCSCGQTFGVSAIAAITSSVKSRGCGLVKRTRSRPSISSAGTQQTCRTRTGRRRSARRSSRSGPSRVTSTTPASTSASISASTSPGRRSVSAPRRLGTMQKRAGVVAADRDRHPRRVRRLAPGRQVGREVLQRLDDLDLGLVRCAGPVRAAPAGWPGCACRRRRRPTGRLLEDARRGPSGPGSHRPRSACPVAAAWPVAGGRGCRRAGCRRSRAPRRC